MALIVRPLFLLAQDSEHLVAALAFGHRHGAVHVGGRGVGALGVSENVEIGYVELLHEFVGLQKILLRFTGEADDEVDADAGVRHHLPDVGYALGVELPAVAALHLRQLLVVARLQRHVKVRREALTASDEVDQLVRAQVGLNAGNAEAGDAVDVVQGAGEIAEERFLARALPLDDGSPVAEVADVDTGQDDLFNAPRGDGFGVADDLLHGGAAALAAGQRDGAEGAFVVAAILDLEEGARPIPEAEAANEGISLFHLSGADHAFGCSAGNAVDVVQNPEFLCCSKDEVNALDVSNFLRLELSVTADYNNLCTCVRAQSPAYDVAALLIGKVRYRASVDHYDISAVLKAHFLVPGFGKLPADGGSFAVIQLAAEGVEGDGSEGHVSQIVK